MKIFLTSLLVLSSLSAWSHCGGCGTGSEPKTSHEHSKEELAKEKAACEAKKKTGKLLSSDEVKYCKKIMNK